MCDTSIGKAVRTPNGRTKDVSGHAVAFLSDRIAAIVGEACGSAHGHFADLPERDIAGEAFHTITQFIMYGENAIALSSLHNEQHHEKHL